MRASSRLVGRLRVAEFILRCWRGSYHREQVDSIAHMVFALLASTYLSRYLSRPETRFPILRNQLPGDHQANLSST